MAAMAGKPAITQTRAAHMLFSPSCYLKHSSPPFITSNSFVPRLSSALVSRKRDKLTAGLKASSSAASPVEEAEEGVSLGTMKLPLNVDLPKFETLLFQWGNSLFQGANLPLAVPLKVDKIPGGARLGFVAIGSDGQPEVSVYIDCLVFPGTDNSGPVFRAVRNGSLKGQAAPGEARIMTSLLDALKKCVALST